MNKYPTVNNGNACIFNLIFNPDNLEAVTKTISDFDLKKESSAHYYFAAPHDFSPSIIVNPWYSFPAAKVAFKVLYDLDPVADTTEEIP